MSALFIEFENGCSLRIELMKDGALIEAQTKDSATDFYIGESDACSLLDAMEKMVDKAR